MPLWRGILNKSTGQKKQNKDGWFDSVVYNAIFFLKSSLENLEKNPRNSVIELYTAIELLFKARLMKEHWSLIVTKPEDANITSFENGDFHSIYLEQAEKRLKNICGEKFKKEALDNFKALGKHRNQIVHFAHTSFNKEKNIVLVEHWASWYYLYDLISNKWSDIFEEYKAEFYTLNESIRKNINYLKIKFEDIQEKLNIERSKGREVLECPSCYFESAVVTRVFHFGKNFECLVCDVKDEIPIDILTTIGCEECGEEVQYFMLTDKKCTHCQNEVSRGYALVEYTKLYQVHDEDEEFDESAYPIGHCHICECKTASVVEVDIGLEYFGMPVCLNCDVRGWNIIECEHCEKYVTGDGDTIRYVGCHLCTVEKRDQIQEQVEQDALNCLW